MRRWASSRLETDDWPARDVGPLALNWRLITRSSRRFAARLDSGAIYFYGPILYPIDINLFISQNYIMLTKLTQQIARITIIP